MSEPVNSQSSSAKVPVRWPAEAIWQAVVPSLPAFTVEVLPQIDSTNSELMRRCRAAASASSPPPPEAILLVAEHQSAGRGRMGRNWHSAAGASLTFSLGMPLLPADWSGLSLAVGVSLADSLAPPTHAGEQLQLKWPNDLWFKGCKLGGILVETASWGDQRYVVIGVGLNVLAPAQSLDAAEQPGHTPGVGATSLQAIWPGVDAPWALQAVAAPLVAAMLAFERDGFAPFQARFAARDALAGRAVHLSDGTEGNACGVGPQGALRVQTAAGMRDISSQEVSVRPLAAAQPPFATVGTNRL
jgi:BirA family biotin operon repressor/biotin-[acetyl-CoA-carboxylase] ligase